MVKKKLNRKQIKDYTEKDSNRKKYTHEYNGGNETITPNCKGSFKKAIRI
jgi:hypothetical protein